jgi:hypothetical protein
MMAERGLLDKDALRDFLDGSFSPSTPGVAEVLLFHVNLEVYLRTWSQARGRASLAISDQCLHPSEQAPIAVAIL